MGVSHFVYPFISYQLMDVGIVSTLAVMNSVAMNSHVQILVWEYIFIFLYQQ